MPRWTLGSGLIAASLLGSAFYLPCPAPACNLCSAVVKRQTLRQELDLAKIVLYGTVASSRVGLQGLPGAGTSEFHIIRVIKDDPFLGNKKVVELPRYVPVVDPKAPPKFIVFCDIINGKLDSLGGRAVNSPALLDYLDGARSIPGKDRTQALLYFFRFLEHEDSEIAADAYMEFARSTDQEIGAVAKRLSPAPLRKLIQNPTTPAERLGMLAFLLGACGGEQDAEFLKKLIEQTTDRRLSNALDGLLAGYIQLRPRQGWDLAAAIVADPRKSFNQRYSVALTLRFYHGWKPAESRPEILRAVRGMLDDGEIADVAIEDLRQWQLWDLTPRVLGQYGKQSHSAPITRRAILRYALSCPPSDQTRQFLEAARRQEPAVVRDLEENLDLNRPK